LSIVASPEPSAVVDSVGLLVAGVLEFGDALGLAVELGLVDAAGEWVDEGLGDGVELALSWLALTA
jgi:hypothetical protein